jgi:hypothetical protein
VSPAATSCNCQGAETRCRKSRQEKIKTKKAKEICSCDYNGMCILASKGGPEPCRQRWASTHSAPLPSRADNTRCWLWVVDSFFPVTAAALSLSSPWPGTSSSPGVCSRAHARKGRKCSNGEVGLTRHSAVWERGGVGDVDVGGGTTRPGFSQTVRSPKRLTTDMLPFWGTGRVICDCLDRAGARLRT